MTDKCIICGAPTEEVYDHPKGVNLELDFCSDCIQSLALQWLADKLSFGIEYLFNKIGEREEPPRWRERGGREDLKVKKTCETCRHDNREYRDVPCLYCNRNPNYGDDWEKKEESEKT